MASFLQNVGTAIKKAAGQVAGIAGKLAVPVAGAGALALGAPLTGVVGVGGLLGKLGGLLGRVRNGAEQIGAAIHRAPQQVQEGLEAAPTQPIGELPGVERNDGRNMLFAALGALGLGWWLFGNNRGRRY